MEPKYPEVAGYQTRLDCGSIDIHIPHKRELQNIKTPRELASIHYSQDQSLTLVNAGMEITEDAKGQKYLFGYINFDTPYTYARPGDRRLGSKLVAHLTESAAFYHAKISQEGSTYGIQMSKERPILIKTTNEGDTEFVEFSMQFDETSPQLVTDFTQFCHAWGISQNTLAKLDPAADMPKRHIPIAQIFIGTDTYDEPFSQTELALRSGIDQLRDVQSNSVPAIDHTLDTHALQIGEQSYQLSLDEMRQVAQFIITAKRRNQHMGKGTQIINEHEVLHAMDTIARRRSE